MSNLSPPGGSAEPASQEPPPNGNSGAPGALVPGASVLLKGLKAKPELNGQRGKLVAFDEEKGRWQVKCADGTKLFKAENLEPCEPPADDGQPRGTAPSAPRERKALPKAALSPSEAVEWVNSSCDEFEALMLPLELEEDVGKIRKQYKSLSLLVHPDKNSHPEADAAFKKLFGAMQKLSDPMEQRMALRRAKGRSGEQGPPAAEQWWNRATVDEMEQAFREMEQKFQRMGFFDVEKKAASSATGVDEDCLWASPESGRDLLEKDLAIFLDARDTGDFARSHIRGAHSLPGHTMEQLRGMERTAAFRTVASNPEQTVIVYSDNGSQLSRCIHVARVLRSKLQVMPHRVLRLSGGLNAWKRHGFPVDGDTRALFAGKVLGNSMMRLDGVE